MKSILTVGAGAVGGYYAACLSDVAKTSVIARGEHGAATSRDGLRIVTKTGESTAKFHTVYSDVKEVSDSYDLIIFATKAYDLHKPLCETLARKALNACVLSLLNGVESEELLASYWPAGQVIAGVSRIAASRPKPGVVLALSKATVEVAAWVQSHPEPATRVHELFQKAEVPAKLRTDANAMLWEKLLWNAGFNGICALTRRPAGELLDEAKTRMLIEETMHEVVRTAQAEGINLRETLVEENIANTKAYFPNIIPSMLQDVLAGRPLEYDALQGVVARRAEAIGLSAPSNATLAALLSMLNPDR